MISAIATVTLLAKYKGDFQKLGIFLKDEFDDFFNLGLSNYLDKQLEKFSKTKTFLFRDESVNFYDVFYPVKLISKKSTIETKENILENVFLKCNFISIIGNAGSGKTMLMKHMFLSCAESMFKIPIVIELRHLNDYQGSIVDYLYSTILNNKVSPNKRILERALESGNFFFLFDGYDEIFSNNKEARTKEIEDLADKYSNNLFLITSRPGADACIDP